MPLFGKKKTSSKEKEAQNKEANGYPRQQQPFGTLQGQVCQSQFGGQPQGPPPPYSATTNGGVNVQEASSSNRTVVCPQAFDAGARFNHGARPAIPPPPPGVMANPAQMAAAQGHTVVVGQRKETIMDGTGDGGYVFW